MLSPRAGALLLGAFVGLLLEPPPRAQPAEPERVLFVVTSHDRLGDTGRYTGAFFPEITHPYEVLTRAGFAVDFVSPRGGATPLIAINLADSLSRRYVYDGAFMDRLERTMTPEEVDPRAYAAVFYAGGHGTMWDLPDDERLARIAAEVYEGGGVVGAVCHGPAGLVNVRLSDGRHLVEGRRVAAFTNEEEASFLDVVPFLLVDRLTERGAVHRGAAPQAAHVEVDGRLVTGQNPASAWGVAEAMVRLLRPAAGAP